MKKLLQFELYKLKKQKSLYICSALVLAGFLLSVLATFALMKLMGGLLEEEAVSPTAVETMLSAVSMSDFTLIKGLENPIRDKEYIFPRLLTHERVYVKADYLHCVYCNNVYYNRIVRSCGGQCALRVQGAG